MSPEQLTVGDALRLCELAEFCPDPWELLVCFAAGALVGWGLPAVFLRFERSARK